VIVPLDLIIFVILITTAVLALVVEDLLAAVALLAGYSLFAALLFAGVNAVDVALVEAALGAGLTGVLFIVAILATTRRSDPKPDPRRRWIALPVIGAFVALMLVASTGLPDRGDPEAPAQLGVSTAFIEGSLEQTQTPNVVTALLADYRSLDTLGETMVIVTAALAAALVLARRVDEPDDDPTAPGAPSDPAATATTSSDADPPRGTTTPPTDAEAAAVAEEFDPPDALRRTTEEGDR
jgi:multicomponent Na+:H+ antiporter subunit B